MKYRAVIYTKTIIVSNNSKEFYQNVFETIERTEEAGQMFGWAESVVDNECTSPGIFSHPPEEYMRQE